MSKDIAGVPDKNKEVIMWLGECIFPQKKDYVFDKFGECLYSLIADGLIITSRSRIGVNPTMMKKVNGYLELSDKGWELYQSIKNFKNE